eukprot:c25994_g1_i2 orf=454-1998(-)
MKRGLNLEFPLSTVMVDACESQFLNDVLKCARILHLNETEIYFIEEDDEGPYSPRNEIEAFGLIHSTLCKFMEAEPEGTGIIRSLIDRVENCLESLSADKIFFRKVDTFQCDPIARLLKWASEKGIKSKLNVAVFEGCGMGGVAIEDIAVGDHVLNIPEQLLICEDMAMKSDMFTAIKELGHLNRETMTLLWSMKERYDPDSEFAPYFSSLPDSFNTGLSFGLDALKTLDDTLILDEILQAKEHLRLQYDSLFPMLSYQYPHLFPEDLYTWDRFLSACELWYSNGVKVIFPDGTIKTCLVPVAGVLNHGLYPHITHYSRIDSNSHILSLRASRPCRAGQQCFLSYGPLSNSHLLTFYGFILDGDNPYDTIPIELDLSGNLYQQALIEKYEIGLSHMVRGSWLSKSKLSPYGLPSRLLAALRIAIMPEDELNAMPLFQAHSLTSLENETKAIEALLSILSPMLESLGTSSSLLEDESTSLMESWDVSLAIRFKQGQRRILQSACESCSMWLKSLS